MSGFAVPASSSPLPAPTTPSSERGQVGDSRIFQSLGSNPSTTPAGPPPSSACSFTPAGPPPGSTFGSSIMSAMKSAKGQAATIRSPKRDDFASHISPFASPSGKFFFANNNFALPDSSPISQSGANNMHLINSDEEMDDDYHHTQRSQDVPQQRNGFGESLDTEPRFGGSVFGNLTDRKSNGQNMGAYQIPKPSSMTKAGNKRSHKGAAISHTTKDKSNPVPKPPENSAIPSIAQNLGKQLGPAPLKESDSLVLGTEGLLNELNEGDSDYAHDSDKLSAVLSNISERLCSVWNTCRGQDLARGTQPADLMLGIGPDENAPLSHSAIYLSTLLLPLHHPGEAKGRHAIAVSRADQLVTSQDLDGRPIQSNPTAYPKIILDWLDQNHYPFESTLAEVRGKRPSPASHQNYWDVLAMLTVRGKFSEVLRLLKSANFETAATAKEDGAGSRGYQGEQLKNVEQVVARAIQIFEACPVIIDDDWHVTGNNWIVYRRLVEKSMDDLTTFAEGRDRDLDFNDEGFQASNFGLSNMTNEMSRSSRRAESRVPWTIFQNLKAMYSVLLGGGNEILSSSQDWVEGTIALTAWWPGDDDDEVLIARRDLARRSLRHSRSQGPRLVDHNPELAYLRRMASAFQRVTNESEDTFFLPNATKPLEVALASIFQNNVKGLLNILKGFSLPVADAVVEIATSGGWLDDSRQNCMDDFDESDLLVLSSYSAAPPASLRETIMSAYAEALFHRGSIVTKSAGSLEGWELAVAVLSRLSPTDDEKTRRKILSHLERLPLDSDETIDKILETCQDYDMFGEGATIVERYADSVLEDSDNYGTALVYYARAHKKRKIKDVLDLLISFSLVQSVAYPASSALDKNLRSLVLSPRESLEYLALLDEDAAEILQSYLSGYATLRRFYEFRDAEHNQANHSDEVSKKDLAIKSILAVVGSAADNIHGGLYDENRGPVVQVDGLLALLGEASVFINQHPSVLSLQQCMSLLKAIEDLSTVTTRIYNQCEEFLRSSLASHHGRAALSSPRTLLKKQMSSMTSRDSGAIGTGSQSGSFSLIGSSLLLEQPPPSEHSDGMRMSKTTVGGDTDSSGNNRVLALREDEDTKRGWDWRDRVSRDFTGKELLQKMRLELAREIGGHWIRGGDF